MQLYILVSIVIALLVIGVAIALVIMMRRSLINRDTITEGKYPRGYWMSVGISIGVGIGAALGVALENIGAGIAIGIAIGSGIGASLEQKNKDNIRPLTEQAQRRQKWGIAIGLTLTSVLAVFLIVVYFLPAR